MSSRRPKHIFQLAEKTWLILLILMFYTIFMVITIALLNLITDNEYSKVKPILPYRSETGQMLRKVKNLNALNFGKHQRKFLSYGYRRKPFVYSFSKGTWFLSEVCKPYKSYLPSSNFYLATLNSGAGTSKIFVHNPEYDDISGTIKDRHSFESENVDLLVSMLRSDPSLGLIDIGTNVGIHALTGAMLGRHVIAIDAVKQNIQHVCASVEYQNFTYYISLVYNAVSDSHGKIKFKTGKDGDFGLGHVDSDDVISRMSHEFANYFQNYNIFEVEAVTLDDILQFPKFTFFKNIFIKIDVEGHEHRVLLGAKELMKTKLDSVKGILMEWQWVSEVQLILDLFSGWNFQPYRFVYMRELLNTNDTGNWPKDVLWLPKTTARAFLQGMG